jgi:hypothetical protein
MNTLQTNDDNNNEKDENIERYKKSWNKLDKGIKLNRIMIFVKRESILHNLSDQQELQLKTLLIQLCNHNGLNKSSEVSYNQETMNIESIKILHFDSSSKKYSVHTIVSKSKNISKSKSNIEKHFTPKSKKN